MDPPLLLPSRTGQVRLWHDRGLYQWTPYLEQTCQCENVGHNSAPEHCPWPGKKANLHISLASFDEFLHIVSIDIFVNGLAGPINGLSSCTCCPPWLIVHIVRVILVPVARIQSLECVRKTMLVFSLNQDKQVHFASMKKLFPINTFLCPFHHMLF